MFVLVFVSLVHFSSNVIKIFQLCFPFELYVNLVYFIASKTKAAFSVRIHRVLVVAPGDVITLVDRLLLVF